MARKPHKELAWAVKITGGPTPGIVVHEIYANGVIARAKARGYDNPGVQRASVVRVEVCELRKANKAFRKGKR